MLAAIAIRCWFDAHGLCLLEQQERWHGNAARSNSWISTLFVLTDDSREPGFHCPRHCVLMQGCGDRHDIEEVINKLASVLSSSIGGLVVKLAVAIRDLISFDSASPGFDSRPMHECLLSPCRRLIFCFLLGDLPENILFATGLNRAGGEEIIWLSWSVGGGEEVSDCYVEWDWK